MNIRTIVLVILGLVLVSAIVLSTTALASVLILGDLHWKRVVLAAGCWPLAAGSWLHRCNNVSRRRQETHTRRPSSVRQILCGGPPAAISQSRSTERHDPGVMPAISSAKAWQCRGFSLSPWPM
jgi:hypothetical protein